MTNCGESIRVVHPLFPTEGGGSIPTSPLQLRMGWMKVRDAVRLNETWHSVLPDFTYPEQKCKAIGAEHKGIYYAVAIWSPPVARRLNWTGRYELRRLAIAPDAPRYTASRMLRVMRLLIERQPKLANVRTLISYQDKDSHLGTIYRAAGWREVNESAVPADGWQSRTQRSASQTNADKVRWELTLQVGDTAAQQSTPVTERVEAQGK
jgi:hypothetical protein